jgi:hypothetical protein
MIFLTLFGSALAACTLPAEVDPNGKCVEDANGFSTLDADSDADIPISLTITTKGETVDAFRTTHPGTAGTLSDNTETDGRYILACPQAAGVKTVQFNVERPASLTAFGGEWVQLFPKDSWENVTNEYEPFTFNDYGAKIPLAEFRPNTNGLTDDAASAGTLNVFMEVKDEGDYEIKFGNPYLTSDGEKWVAVEFKQTILRVGAPWADCSGSTLAAPSYAVGSIMPLLFGGPNLNSVALKAGFPSYDAVIAELSGVTVPVKVVLEVFTADKKAYTASYTDGQCYKAGTTCPEAHVVCEASYCEMDVWAQIITDLKAASPMVSVLGSVGVGTTSAEYSSLDVDGIYFVGTPVEADYDKTTVSAIGAPLFAEDEVDDATVYVTLASSELGLWNPFSWYPYVSPSKWAAMVTAAADTSDVATLFDRGYGWVYLTSEADFSTKSSLTPALLDAIEATATTRRLEGRRLQASEPEWGCDDTLFECRPICMQQRGLVTSKVSDSLCAGAPLDPCECKCLHEAQWACEGDAVVCKARYGAGELQTVGDMVCQTRGARKPTSVAELRVASQCEPMTEMRGSAPTAECLAEWAPAEKVSEPEPASSAPAAQDTEAPTAKPQVPLITDEASYSMHAALAALALVLYA